MANYSASILNGSPTTPYSKSVVLLNSVDFGTGAINTAVVTEMGAFRRATVYIDITGANTGGMSAAYTMAIAGTIKGAGFWATLSGLGTFTNTAYLKTFSFEGGAGFSGYPTLFDDIRLTITNPNTGTGAGVTAVTGTMRILISASEF